MNDLITIKSQREIELLRVAGNVVYKTHQYLKPFIKEGVTTEELNRLGEEFIRSQGCTPSFKGYGGFPYALCISINSEVVHGFPSKRKLKKGKNLRMSLTVRLIEDHGCGNGRVQRFQFPFHGDQDTPVCTRCRLIAYTCAFIAYDYGGRLTIINRGIIHCAGQV